MQLFKTSLLFLCLVLVTCALEDTKKEKEGAVGHMGGEGPGADLDTSGAEAETDTSDEGDWYDATTTSDDYDYGATDTSSDDDCYADYYDWYGDYDGAESSDSSDIGHESVAAPAVE